jgi:hypothetical protein
MPKTCEPCRFLTPADAEAPCPHCGRPLRFTLLPPPGEPDVLPSRRRVPRSGGGAWLGGLWETLIGTPVGLVVLAVVALAGSMAYHDWASRDRGPAADAVSGRVRVGMHFSEVGRALDTGPAPRPSYPRMRDRFPSDEFGDGVLNYEGRGVKLRVHFVGGYATSVTEEPGSAEPGSFRYEVRITQRNP